MTVCGKFGAMLKTLYDGDGNHGFLSQGVLGGEGGKMGVTFTMGSDGYRRMRYS